MDKTSNNHNTANDGNMLLGVVLLTEFKNMNLNNDKETVELWKSNVGKTVKVFGSRYEDVNTNTLGTYIAKHVDIAMHYILLNGEEYPRPFHIFEFEWVS